MNHAGHCLYITPYKHMEGCWKKKIHLQDTYNHVLHHYKLSRKKTLYMMYSWRDFGGTIWQSEQWQTVIICAIFLQFWQYTSALVVYASQKFRMEFLPLGAQ